MRVRERESLREREREDDEKKERRHVTTSNREKEVKE